MGRHLRRRRRSVTVAVPVAALVLAAAAAGGSYLLGKTGTAQYGTGPDPPSHGWFIGYRGDLAFAVLVEGGGTGADSAGPIADALLREL